MVVLSFRLFRVRDKRRKPMCVTSVYTWHGIEHVGWEIGVWCGTKMSDTGNTTNTVMYNRMYVWIQRCTVPTGCRECVA